MFSSLNELNICELNPVDSETCEKIMLFRCPYVRTISCFLNWMVRVPETQAKEGNLQSKEQVIGDANNRGNGWLIPLLLDESDFDFNTYKTLLEENEIVELFKIYTESLPRIKNNNVHLHSQVQIVEEQKFSIDLFINIDKKAEIAVLEEKVKQELPITNESAYEDKQLLRSFLDENPNYKSMIYDVYKDDFDFLPIE